MAQLLPEDVELVEEFWGNVHEFFVEKMQEAYESGALPDDVHPIEVARCCLQIAAYGFSPLSDYGKKLLKNLEHFI